MTTSMPRRQTCVVSDNIHLNRTDSLHVSNKNKDVFQLITFMTKTSFQATLEKGKWLSLLAMLSRGIWAQPSDPTCDYQVILFLPACGFKVFSLPVILSASDSVIALPGPMQSAPGAMQHHTEVVIFNGAQTCPVYVMSLRLPWCTREPLVLNFGWHRCGPALEPRFSRPSTSWSRAIVLQNLEIWTQWRRLVDAKVWSHSVNSSCIIPRLSYLTKQRVAWTSVPST